jgi:hypothetical protein
VGFSRCARACFAEFDFALFVRRAAAPRRGQQRLFEAAVYVLELLPTPRLEINAIQRALSVVIQKSIKEGFGLTVSEALLKSQPPVGVSVPPPPKRRRDKLVDRRIGPPTGEYSPTPRQRVTDSGVINLRSAFFTNARRIYDIGRWWQSVDPLSELEVIRAYHVVAE